MGSWKLPYSVPKFTSEEFEKVRADYIAKYGHQVYLPGWEDLVHVPIEQSFTEQEEVRWAAKDWDFFTPERLRILKAIKTRRKNAYLRLLGSPQPHILRNRGTILVAIDNNQDALSTLTTVLRLAYPILPLVLKRLVSGPVGWIMTTADILNLCTRIMTPERPAKATKRLKDKLTDSNPFSKKAKANRLLKFYGRPIGKGEIIEVLQTTDQMFGIGISLGAVMNLPFDIIAGNVRTLMGEKVTVIAPMESEAFWITQAAVAWKSLTTLFTTPSIFAENLEGPLGPLTHPLSAAHYLTTLGMGLTMLIASHAVAVAMHVLQPSIILSKHNIDINDVVVKALEPRKSYLREVMEEAGDNPDAHTGWPVNNQLYVSPTDLASQGPAIATKNFQDWCYQHRYREEAFLGAQIASDASLFALANVAGDHAVEYDYISAEKTTHALLNAGHRLPYYLTQPSGWWKKEEDYDYKADVSKKVFDYAPHIANLAAVRPQISPHLRSNWLERMNQSASVKSEQLAFWQQSQLQGDIFPEKPKKTLKDELAETILPNLEKYFNDHDSNGSSPSTPSFLKYLEDDFSVKIPKNTTAETLP